MTSRDRATREETRQAISKAQETARSRGAAAAAELRKSLDSKFKAEALAREEEKRRLERRCDVLSREADALRFRVLLPHHDPHASGRRASTGGATVPPHRHQAAGAHAAAASSSASSAARARSTSPPSSSPPMPCAAACLK